MSPFPSSERRESQRAERVYGLNIREEDCEMLWDAVGAVGCCGML